MFNTGTEHGCQINAPTGAQSDEAMDAKTSKLNGYLCRKFTAVKNVLLT